MKQAKDQYKPIEKLELGVLKEELPKLFQKVSCPSCEQEVIADNLNLQSSVAKCSNCNVIFSIEKEVESVKLKKEIKQEIFRPEGIDLFYFKEDLDITVQQHVQGLDAYGIVFFPSLAFLSLLVFFGDKHTMSPFIPIAFVLGSLYYLYKVLNYSKNKTYITVNSKSLSIKSRPKNFKKDKNYDASDIDQLYLKLAGDGSGYYTIYMILDSLEGQKHQKLLTVNTLSKAKYLEQEIERYLQIEDRVVPEATA